MGIEQDTITLAFAATTADTVEGFTAGLLHGFSLGGDHSLIYTGARQGRFLLNYSVSFTFAEAGTLTSYVKVNTDIKYKSRRRQIAATAGNVVTVWVVVLSRSKRTTRYPFGFSPQRTPDRMT